jgi:hypothetical protein
MNKSEKSSPLQRKFWQSMGIAAFSIPILLGLLISNWFFQITSFQKLEGMPLLLTIFICPIGIVLGVISLIKTQYIIAKWGIVFNSILLILPSLYFIFGTLIFGP